MDSAEFSEWIAYYSIEPFGQDRADINHAITATVIANAHGAKSKPADWMPRWNAEPEKPESNEMLLAKMRVFAMQFEGAK